MRPPIRALHCWFVCVALAVSGSATGADLSRPTCLDWPRLHHDPAGIAVLDIDADGHLDIVAQEGWMIGRFGIYKGPTFEGPEFLEVAWLTQAMPIGIDLPVADVDGDGRDDLIAILPEGKAKPPTVGAAILAGSRAVVRMPALADPFRAGERMAAGDIDGDGFADVAVAVGRGVWVYWGPDLASRTKLIDPPTAEEIYFGTSLAIADIDGDRRCELFIGSPGRTDISRPPEVRRSRIHVFSGPDLPLAGTIQSPDRGSGFSPHKREQFAVGDVTGDGHADLVWQSRDGIRLYSGPDLISASGTVWLSGFDGFVSQIFLKDVDGDGVANLVARMGGILQVLPIPPRTDGGWFPPHSGGREASPVILRDLDGKGGLEIVALDGWPCFAGYPEGPPGPRDLFAFRRGDDVFLAWRNRAAYDRILVVAGQEVIAEIPGDRDRWQATVKDSDFVSFQVVGIAGARETLRSNFTWPSRWCDVRAGLSCTVEGTAIRLRWFTHPFPDEVRMAIFRDDGEIMIAPHSPGEYLDTGPGEVADRLYVAQLLWYRPFPERAGIMCRTPGKAVGPFVRGETDGDGVLSLSDAIVMLEILFWGGPRRSCPRALDANADRQLTIADPIYLLNHIFAGGPPPPAPYPTCGLDPDPEGLPCEPE